MRLAMTLISKVVNGGQLGVDRAALDAALAFGLSIGGWCTRGRQAEDGMIPARYPLVETRSTEAHMRCQRNVETSSATLVITRGSPMGITRYAIEAAESMCRPALVIDVADAGQDHIDMIADWLVRVRPQILHVTGPRESGSPGITDAATRILKAVFAWAGEPILLKKEASVTQLPEPMKDPTNPLSLAV